MKKLFLGGIAAVMLCAAGCRTQFVTVNVTPSDARVIANGVEYNNASPFFIETSTSRQLAITAYRDGYKDALYVVDYKLSTLGKIEAWTSILILPAFGLLFDNAWELKENNVSMSLEPMKSGAAGNAPHNAQRKDLNKILRTNGAGADLTSDPEAKKIFQEL